MCGELTWEGDCEEFKCGVGSLTLNGDEWHEQYIRRKAHKHIALRILGWLIAHRIQISLVTCRFSPICPLEEPNTFYSHQIQITKHCFVNFDFATLLENHLIGDIDKTVNSYKIPKLNFVRLFHMQAFQKVYVFLFVSYLV